MLDGIAAVFARMRVPLGFIVAAAVLWLSQPTPGSLAIGAVVAAIGEALRIWAAGHLDKGREVTQSGPYRMTRHPLYAGSAIIAVGLAIASARGVVAALIAAYVAIAIGSAVRHEEASMRAAFGDEDRGLCRVASDAGRASVQLRAGDEDQQGVQSRRGPCCGRRDSCGEGCLRAVGWSRAVMYNMVFGRDGDSARNEPARAEVRE